MASKKIPDIYFSPDLNDEEIIWEGSYKHNIPKNIIIDVLVLLAVIGAIIFYAINLSLEKGLLHYIALMAMLIFSIVSFIRSLLPRREKYYFTTDRIIIHQNPKKKNYISYFFIDSLGFVLLDDNIFLKSDALRNEDNRINLSHLASIKGAENPQKLLNQINQVWFSKSKYQEDIQKFTLLRDEFSLRLSKLNPAQRTVRITGNYEGLDIHFELRDLFYPDIISIEIKTPNPKNYILNLQPEKPRNKIGKVFGQQDILIQSDIFDPKYLIQSNDEDITHEILDYEMQQLILKSNAYLKGTFVFGNTQGFSKKRKSKLNSDLLDEHLIKNNTDSFGNISTLKFYKDRIGNTNNRIQIIDNSLDLIRASIKLSLNIKKATQ